MPWSFELLPPKGHIVLLLDASGSRGLWLWARHASALHTPSVDLNFKEGFHPPPSPSWQFARGNMAFVRVSQSDKGMRTADVEGQDGLCRLEAAAKS